MMNKQSYFQSILVKTILHGSRHKSSNLLEKDQGIAMFDKKALLVFGLTLLPVFTLNGFHATEASGAQETSARIMVVIEENLKEVPESRTVESSMNQELLQSGFILVDPEQAKKLREQVRAEVLHRRKINKEALKKIGEDLDCDILITGTAVADHYASAGVVKAYVADLHIRILSPSTGQILASFSTRAKGRGYQAGPAIRSALERAARMATQDLLEKNLLNIEPVIKLFLVGLSDAEARKLALSLARSLNTGTRVVYASPDLSEIEIEPGPEVTPETVLKQARAGRKPSLEVLQRVGFKIVLREKGFHAAKPPVPNQSAGIRDSLFKTEKGFVAGDLAVGPILIPNIYPARLLNYSAAFSEATLKNLSEDTPLKNVRFRIFVPEFMSVPSEKRIPVLKAGEEVLLTLHAIFNRDRLYGNLQSTKINTEITVSYEGLDPVVKNITIEVYGRNTMNWKDTASLLNFVTPTDPVVKNFTSSVLSRVDLSGVETSMVNMLKADAIFTALASMPLRYLSDPNNDFINSTLDYVQFPRETLQRKSGDCDDMSVLFASCLESVGIPTRFLLTRDHVFLEFSTGMLEKSWWDICFDKQRFDFSDDSLWIPVEITKFCSESHCFLDAWKEGAYRYTQLNNKTNMEKVTFNQDTKLYPPFPLPDSKQQVVLSVKDLPVRIAESLAVLYRDREQALSREKAACEKRLAANPGDVQAGNRLGILLCKSGETQKAREQFLNLLKANPSNGTVIRNLGNTYVLMGKPSKAVEEYRLVPGYDENPELLYNMGVAYFLLDDRKNALENLRRAYDHLPSDWKEKRMKWMLGVSDLKQEKTGISEPWMEVFRNLIYESTSNGNKRKMSGPVRGKQSKVPLEGQMSISDTLWWTY